MRHVVIAALLFGASTTHVLAQPDAATMERLKRDALDSQLGTLSVVAQPNFADGRLSGCTVEYNVLAKDWAYKKGDYIKVSGAFGLMEAGSGTIGVVLKVILHDVDPRGMQLTPSPPARANFVTSRFSTTQSAAVASYQSDTPGRNFCGFSRGYHGWTNERQGNDRVQSTPRRY